MLSSEDDLSIEDIKKNYLTILSLELIKRGIAEEKTKEILDEVTISLSEFMEESNIETLDQLEENFGSVDQFCENNSLNRNREAAIGQYISLGLIITLLTGIIILGLGLLIIYPFNRIFSNQEYIHLLTQDLVVENGIVGSLFGLNMTTWIIYQYIKDRYSRWDIRERIKLVLLILYWFIFVLWIVMVVSYYTSTYEIIDVTLNYGYSNLIIEGAIRWFSIGVFLGTTAALFTFKYVKTKNTSESHKKDSFIFDKLKSIWIYFVISVFVFPYPGIGVFVVLIGISILFYSKITTVTWLMGSVSILAQLVTMLFMLEAKAGGYVEDTIIFGIKLNIINNSGNAFLFIAIIIICVIIVWSVACYYKLDRKRKRSFPKLKVPKKKLDIVPILLLIIIVVATLGTKPQYLVLEGQGEVEMVTQEQMVAEYRYHIPPVKGTVYISLYTYLEIFEDYPPGFVYVQEGNWSIRVVSTSFPSYELNLNGSLNDASSHMYYFDTYQLGVTYLKLQINGSGSMMLRFEYNHRPYHPYVPVHSIHWESAVPWFPTPIESGILIITLLSVFVRFESLQIGKRKEIEHIREK